MSLLLYQFSLIFSLFSGQFWNVPVRVRKFTGRSVYGRFWGNAYMVDVDKPNGDRRSFVGFLYRSTWEGEEGPCLYVGNGQSGPTYEVASPNDGVIEGVYSDYAVSGGFVEDFKFKRFQSQECATTTNMQRA